MKKQNSARALLLSSLALLLCVSMLVGSTFAWFTDSVVSANNIIKSGNLDVVLEYKTNWSDAWAAVQPDTKLFSDSALYEPGYTEVVFLRVANAGTLALKYELKVDILSESSSTNVAGEEFFLSDYLEIGTYVEDEYSSGFNYADILMPTMFGTREKALSNVQDGMSKLTDKTVATSNAPVLPGEKTSQVVVLVLNMPETVGNEANHKTDVAAPQINLGVTLLATQLVEEHDSFGPEYDKDATYPAIVNTPAELAAAFANGGNVVLGSDMELAADTTLNVVAGVKTVIDLNGHTLSATNTRTATHNFMIDVKGGELTMKNGTVALEHTGTNMGWNGATTVIDVTAGGVLNLEGVTVENKGGTDMNFAVHMNNWGEVTLNADNCKFLSDYCGVRVFNSGADMNNVTITNSTLSGKNRAFWVHNYDSTDFGGKVYSGASAAYDKAVVDARLNLDIANGNTFTVTDASAKSPIRYGFNVVTYVDANGNVIP